MRAVKCLLEFYFVHGAGAINSCTYEVWEGALLSCVLKYTVLGVRAETQ